MAVERTIYCDGPGCGDGQPVHASTATPAPYLAVGFIETRLREPGAEHTHHFCGWDCLMKFAAEMPLPERIEMGGPDA